MEKARQKFTGSEVLRRILPTRDNAKILRNTSECVNFCGMGGPPMVFLSGNTGGPPVPRKNSHALRYSEGSCRCPQARRSFGVPQDDELSTRDQTENCSRWTHCDNFLHRGRDRSHNESRPR